MNDILNSIKYSIVNLDLDATVNSIKEALKNNIDVKSIINALAEGMQVIGVKYEKGEYFISDLIVAGEIFKEAMSILKPKIIESREEARPLGRIIIGTVYGDIHDIGKNLVATFLEAAGFEIIDLGVDVSPQKFIEAIKQYNPDIVGMSALLTSTMMHMKNIIEAIKREGLRDKVKIIIGGAPITEKFAIEIGADAYGENAYKAVEICRRLIEKKTKTFNTIKT